MTATAQQPFGTMVISNKKRATKTREFNYLEARDKRMRFNNSRDPIYYVFNCIENRPISTLAKEFVKDSFFDTVNFISKAVGI